MTIRTNNISRALYGVLAIAVVTATATWVTTDDAHALYKKCKGQTIAGTGGRKLSNLVAKGSAKSKWRATAHATYSKRWSKWLLAKNKTISCKKSGRKWRCTAAAKPCIVPL